MYASNLNSYRLHICTTRVVAFLTRQPTRVLAQYLTFNNELNSANERCRPTHGAILEKHRISMKAASEDAFDPIFHYHQRWRETTEKIVAAE